jgi:hypothetical protein
VDWTTPLRGNWQWCYTEPGGGKLNPTGEVELELPYYEDPWRVTYVLPGPRSNIPTLGWEARREGVDDYRYLQTLREAIAPGLASKSNSRRRVAREAQGFLEELSRRARRTATPTPATQAELIYNFLLQPDLTPAAYDEMRRRTADYIVTLQAR